MDVAADAVVGYRGGSIDQAGYPRGCCCGGDDNDGPGCPPPHEWKRTDNDQPTTMTARPRERRHQMPCDPEQAQRQQHDGQHGIGAAGVVTDHLRTGPA
jgi:hypothetical protein